MTKRTQRKMRKLLLTVCCAALLVCVSVMATVAYLTDNDTVTNTFTVGNVDITLDEAKVNIEGKPVESDGTVVDKVGDAPRVKENSYKLIPGHTYTKDPTVTVKKGSEESYIRVLVTFTNYRNLKNIFDAEFNDIVDIFGGYDASSWIYKTEEEDSTNNTKTYEFRYKETVAAPTGDIRLDAVFDNVKLPGTINNAQLPMLEGTTLTIVAQAIQADGFVDADAAWDKFVAPVPTATPEAPVEP